MPRPVHLPGSDVRHRRTVEPEGRPLRTVAFVAQASSGPDLSARGVPSRPAGRSPNEYLGRGQTLRSRTPRAVLVNKSTCLGSRPLVVGPSHNDMTHSSHRSTRNPSVPCECLRHVAASCASFVLAEPDAVSPSALPSWGPSCAKSPHDCCPFFDDRLADFLPRPPRHLPPWLSRFLGTRSDSARRAQSVLVSTTATQRTPASSVPSARGCGYGLPATPSSSPPSGESRSE